MLQILRHHLVCNIAAAPSSISYCPEVLAPVLPPQFWEFFLQSPRCSPFQPLHHIAYQLRWRVLNQHMHMILAHYTFQYSDVFCIAYLHDQVSTALLDLPLQDGVAVLRHPDQMNTQARDGVAAVAILRHASFLPQSRILRKMCSN